MHRYSLPLLIAAGAIVTFLAIGAFVSGDVIQLVAYGEGTLLHLVGVGLVTFLFVLALPRWWLVWGNTVVLATGAVELVQPFFGRGSQWSDFMAGVAGLLIGTATAGVVLGAVQTVRGRSR